MLGKKYKLPHDSQRFYHVTLIQDFNYHSLLKLSGFVISFFILVVSIANRVDSDQTALIWVHTVFIQAKSICFLIQQKIFSVAFFGWRASIYIQSNLVNSKS